MIFYSDFELDLTAFQLMVAWSLTQWAASKYLSLEELTTRYSRISLRKKYEPGMSLK